MPDGLPAMVPTGNQQYTNILRAELEKLRARILADFRQILDERDAATAKKAPKS